MGDRDSRSSRLCTLAATHGRVVLEVDCGRGRARRDDRASLPRPRRTIRARTAPLPPVAGATGPRIVILGDSLTAGLGLPMARAYPSLLQRRLDDAGLMYTIVNAGVSGDTSAGGLSRLDWALDGDVRILVLALGGNDGLRGLPIAELSHNLSQIIERAQSRGVTVILAGMEAPPNYGVDYTLAFHKAYPALAKKYRVALIPFLLERVAGIAAAESSRRHSSDRRRRADRGRHGVERAEARHRRRRPPRRPWKGSQPMIELRDVSKTVMSGSEPLTILHPLSLADSARPVPGDRRTVGQRQVDAARSAGRAGRADLRLGVD